MLVPFKNIPTFDYQTKSWSTTTFPDQPAFASFLLSIFKEPGEYEFDESVWEWNKLAVYWEKHKYYTELPQGTKDWREFWDFEKRKNRLGVIWKNGDKTWYTPRCYYMLINFLPITNKEKDSRETFCDVRDVQYHMALYEKIAQSVHRFSPILKKRQMLSEQPHSEEILGEFGWTTMGQVKVGDRLWNPDGTLTTVLDKSFHPNADIYEFFFDDGRKVRCGIEHNWQLFDNQNSKDIVLNTSQILTKGLVSNKTHAAGKEYDVFRYSIKQTAAIPLADKIQLPINPYTLGVLIGDGTYLGNSVNFVGSPEDSQIVDEILSDIGSDYEISSYKIKDANCNRYGICYKRRMEFKDEGRKFGYNPLIRGLKKIGVYGEKSCRKSIPEIYKNASIKDRISLIQGLMDTDGFVNSKGLDIHFTTCSKILAEDVAYILRSLGVKCFILDKGTFYRVRISGDISFNLFRLKRKVNRQYLRKGRRMNSRTNLIEIRKLDYTEDSSCIVVDNPNRLYITKDFITTHNSYYHCAKLINVFWFEKHKRLKMLASDDAFVSGEQGSWMILDQYKDFLNQNTPWYRNCEPNEVGNWQQKIKVKIKGKWMTKGNRSTIVSRTLKRDPKKGIGGPGYINFYEEGGIAPTADQTLEYLNPAMESGLTKTGDFVIAGSVGDLKECKPLEAFMKDPDIYGMLAVPTRWYDDSGVVKMCGLFIPEQYGMPPFIDQFGNSMVKEALAALEEAEIEWKKLPPDLYQLKKSQKPKTIQEAFDFRSALFFPTQMIQRRQQIIKEQIKEGTLKPKKGIMDEDKDGNPIFVPLESLPAAERPPEMEFPIDPKLLDKRGVTIIYQPPQKDLELGMNFAGVDSVEANVTTTSNSLFSVSIVSRTIEVHHTDKDGVQTISYEGGKLLACWTGRYDDINDTNRQGELLIRLYKALSACERNKPNFINHLRRKGYSKLILRRKELTLFKDVDMTGYDTDEWGVYLGSDGKANDIINGNILEDLTTTLDAIHKKNKDGSLGEVVKTVRGLDLIDDYWTLEELKLYHKYLNTDRRISFGLAKTAAKCYELSYKKKIHRTEQPTKKQPAKTFGYNLLHQPYRGKPRSMLG